ncbi:FHA domain-containing protein [Humibacter sp. RRB41]|uniref:FHA domain-containing protein n=1 Tax=Humibacter sp. RRB41 TaxID=2919946 RepID=UPI001FAAF7EC|nr:FHA domain-containing protein [Humibacter sp. RRB41]
MDTPGFITPPPGLIPPREDTGNRTERMPPRTSLPVFNPPGTSQASAPTSLSRTWLVVLPTGARVPVNGALLVGRNPVRFDPWNDAELLPVDDPARSVSKTHAVIEAADDGVRITDLHSTNGVSVVDSSGAATALTAGAPSPVAAGVTVLLGSFRLQVAQG